MSTYENSKSAWRKWFEHAELSQLLQTEAMTLSGNSRDITIQGQGKYIAAIKLKFLANVTASDAETPISGADVTDFFVDNFRIKSQGKLTEQLFTSGHVIEHLHQVYLDKEPVVDAPTFSGAGSDVVTADVIIPCSMEGPFNVTYLANLAITDLYVADVTLDDANVQINIISTDTPPPLVFAFSSQTTSLPAAGNFNVTTLTQGFLRESLSLMGFAAGDITTVQYILDDGRGVLYADIVDLTDQFQLKYQTTMGTLSSPMDSEVLVETAYLSGGVPMPWRGAGRLVITTDSGGAVTPDIVEVLIATPVSQQLATGDRAQPTSQRPRTDLSAGGVATGPKPRTRY